MEVISQPTTQDVINQRFAEMVEFLISSGRIKNKSRLAETLGISQAHLNSVSLRTPGKNATPNMISRAVQIFPEINPSWLLGHDFQSMVLEGNLTSKGQAALHDFLDLPFVRTSLRASFSDSIVLGQVPEVDTIRVMYVPPKVYRTGVVFEVDGDSMEPNYVSGARVLGLPVDQANWEYISSGVYAICFGNSFVLKRVKDNQIMSEGILTLHSDNPLGGSMPIRVSDIYAIWKIDQIVFSPAR